MLALLADRQDRGDGGLGLRGVVVPLGGGGAVPVELDQRRGRARGARAGGGGHAGALRRTTRARRPPLPGSVLDRLLRRVALHRRRVRHGRGGGRLLGVRARRARDGAVPDRRLLCVLAVRRGPARPRRARPARRAVQGDHALDRGRHDPAAAVDADRAAGDPAGVRRRSVRDRERCAPDPGDRSGDQRERRGRGVRPDHGGTNGLGPGRLLGVRGPRPDARVVAGPSVRDRGCGGRAGDHDRGVELSSDSRWCGGSSGSSRGTGRTRGSSFPRPCARS